MREVAPCLFQSDVEHPFGNAVCTVTYLVTRASGNILFYSSSHIERHFDFIEQMGGVTAQYVNHRDEASFYCDVVQRRFGAPLYCHILEQDAISRKCQVGGTFSERNRPSFDLEIIPTPGHCPGSTCFVADCEGHRFLFTGDTFYPLNGVWSVAIADGNQSQMIESLKHLLDLEIDGLLPSLYIGPVDFQLFESQIEGVQLALKACISRLERGATH